MPGSILPGEESLPGVFPLPSTHGRPPPANAWPCCGKKIPPFSRSACIKPPHFTLVFHRREFPVSKGLPANTNTKFLFVWAEGRGGRICIAMDGKWPVRGYGSLLQWLSAWLAARDHKKSCLQPAWSFPSQIEGRSWIFCFPHKARAILPIG